MHFQFHTYFHMQALLHTVVDTIYLFREIDHVQVRAKERKLG